MKEFDKMKKILNRCAKSAYWGLFLSMLTYRFLNTTLFFEDIDVFYAGGGTVVRICTWLFLKPQTFMNLSGESIREAVDFYKIDPETELIVIYDDISLAPGNLRIRKKGSAGGHNGMKNIILHLGTQVFSRIRVGVGEKPAGWDLADYVLGGFSKEDEALVKEACEHAAEAAAEILTDGPDKAMNDFN